MPDPNHLIAYFSLEIGLEPTIPTYSGGLGVLAGDTLRAAADLGLPFAGVTLLYRDGYFTQGLDPQGRQIESRTPWEPETLLEEMPVRTYVPIEGRTTAVRAFRLMLRGGRGHHVPVYFLDTDLPENTDQDRAITRALYAGDPDHRVKQEAVLGIAGKRMIRSLSHDAVCFHMNEGHAFLLIVELLSEHLARFDKAAIDHDAVAHARRHCVFTTHTPVEAGHDRFAVERVRAIVGDHPLFARHDLYARRSPEELNTTVLALNLSRYANGVARSHAEVSRRMFPGHAIDAVTNGVHARSWVAPPMAARLDRHVPSWRFRSADLRLAAGIPESEIRAAHAEAKAGLLDHVAERTGSTLDPGRFTIAFARRATAYKRPHMLVSDLDRLRRLNDHVGPIQIVYAGKAHPHDGRGKELIRRILAARDALEGQIPIVFVPDYDIALCRLLVAGSDLWLNTPEPPLEASGTSGMKAALNGVPSLSTLDGWWLEGHIEGVTGWAIEGRAADPEAEFDLHAASMYDKLEEQIVPLFTNDPAGWGRVMRSAIALNGAYFTTERMVRDYVSRAYLH